jgi:hypothetical protein
LAITLALRSKTASCDSITALVDLGSLNSNGYVNIYTAPRPAAPESPIGAALRLATLPLADPAFSAATNGVAEANGLTSTGINVDATGTPSWYRVFDKDNNAIWDGSISLTGGGGDMQFNDLNFIKDGKIVIQSFKAVVP